MSAEIRVVVGKGKNLASSRKIYCTVDILDQKGDATEQKKSNSHKNSSNPIWNDTLKFKVKGADFAGVVVRVWEKHTFFKDKFLGILTIKFNTNMIQDEDVLDDWFTLSKRKKKDTVSGQIYLKVIYGDSKATRSRKGKGIDGVGRASSGLNESASTVAGKVPEEENKALTVSKHWAHKDNLLEQSKFVVIEEDNDSDSESGEDGEDGEDGKSPGRKKRGTGSPSTAPKSSPTGPTKGRRSSSGRIGRAENKDAVEKKEAELEKKKKRPKKNVKVVTANTPDKPKKKDPKPTGGDSTLESSVPASRADQISLICQKCITTGSSLVTDVEEDDCDNLVFTMKADDEDTERTVTLMIPDNIERGEYMLFTNDGVVELGTLGSITSAMNRVVKEYADKIGVPPSPVFPVNKQPKFKSKGRASLFESVRAFSDDDGDFGMDFDDDTFHQDTSQTSSKIHQHVAEYEKLHGKQNIAVLTDTTGDYTVRMALDPRGFLSDILCEVWGINPNKRIVIQIELVAPYYMDAYKLPALSLYQTGDGALDAKYLKDVASFGLAWQLQKRIEDYMRQHWPPTNTHLFLDVANELVGNTMRCTKTCVICNKPLAFEMLKPSICDSPLCLYSYDQYGLGVDVAAIIKSKGQVVDLLISSTKAAAMGDIKRFNPFPNAIEVRQVVGGKEVIHTFKNSSGKPDKTKVGNVLEKIPSIADLQKFPDSPTIKEYLDGIDILCYPLLRWCLTSNRAHMSSLKPSDRITQIGTTIQLLLLSCPPKKELKFQQEKKKKGSFYAFHGSAFNNWHCILRQGLKNYSGTEFMTTGAVYGNGIYLAPDSGTSLSYAKTGSGWTKSMFGTSGLQVMALCEVINGGYKANPYYVISNEDHIITRYLFIFNASNKHCTTRAVGLKIPPTTFDNIQL